MRVLFISQYFWPENFGINALARALSERGVAITVLTGQPNYPDGQVFPGYSAFSVRHERYEGIELIRLPLFPRGKQSSWRLAMNYLSFIVSGAVFGPWLLRNREFETVFVYAPSPLLQALPAILLARLKRVPVALWVQDLWPESLAATGFVKNRAVLAIVELVVRFIYRHTDLILIPSEAFRTPIEKLSANPGKIRYYPNAWIGQTVEDGSRSKEVDMLVDDIASGFSVVFAGNLGTAQALDTVIDAAENLQCAGTNIRFFLIGSGSLSPWLSAEVKRRGLKNVLLPGRFPPEAMAHFYAAASTLLVSLRDEPIFSYTIPSKVQGYLAAGKPVIAALNGEGARVVIEAGAGLACAAGDAAALAQCVQSLARLSDDARAEMGENARRYAMANFSLDRLASELVGHFQKLVAMGERKTGEEYQ